MPFELVQRELVGLALTLPRIAAAFLLLPLLSPQNIPPLVRNSFFVSIAMLAYPVAKATAPVVADAGTAWSLIVVKELFLGAALGFVFGIVFWAIGAAGNIIDAKVGTTFANVLDPIQGESTSLLGQFLSQFAAWLFMASGAFLIFMDLLLGSYAIWPIAEPLPALRAETRGLFIDQFNYFMTLAVLFSAPVIVVLMLADLALGLVNRYAQQLQVFVFAMPIKGWLAVWVLLLLIGSLVEVVVRRIADNRNLNQLLQSLF